MNKYRADSNRRTKQKNRFTMLNKMKSRLAGKKLTKSEMKDVLGGSTAGGRTVCVTCSETIGGDPHNVMCVGQRADQLCVTSNTTSFNGIMCVSLTTGFPNPILCPAGTMGEAGNTGPTQP
jgi:hypothetical protein